MEERIPQYPPMIAPIEGGIARPRWSVMIPAYNCINYLPFALRSVLEQDLGEDKMQIEVVDDCSTDGDVKSLVEEIGKGRIRYFRQQINKGSLRNFETCINRAQGELVHMLHGDDLVKPEFYQEIGGLFEAYDNIGAAFTKYTYVDEKGVETVPGRDELPKQPGIVHNWLYKIAERQRVQPPAMVVKRCVYEHLGGFYAVHYGEDWEMWIRIAAHYKVAYSPKCLALYRSGQGHNANITGISLTTGQNIKDILKVISITQKYLPEERRLELKRIAKRNFAIHYAKAANRIYINSKKAAFIQAWGAIKMHLNIRTAYFLLRLYFIHLFPFIRLKVLKD
jgi:glycosyltransferase involved in cell wall biosynthesis